MSTYDVPDSLLHWADEMPYAVTICDSGLRIVYMNDRSRQTFSRHGDIIGHDLLQYHPPHAVETIKKLLSGEIPSNAYTIEKNGQRKLIYQAPWRLGGEIAGLVELSLVLPPGMPHYVRG